MKERERDENENEENEEEESASEVFDSDDFDSDSDDDDEEEEEKGEEDEEEGEVQTSFEFFDPTEGDFLGMKGLLNGYLDGEVYDCSGLVDHVIKQKTVGSVVRLEEQLDPIAVVSVINLQKHQDTQFLGDIVTFLRKKAPTDKEKEMLAKDVFERKGKEKIGLVVSERVVNCPMELSSPLNQAIFDEIEWATEDEPTQERRDEFKMDNFLLLSRVYFSEEDKVAKGKGKKKGKRQKTEAAAGDIVYVRPEDEYFHKECDWSFTFPANRAENTPGLVQHRMVMWIKKEGVKRARKELDKLFGDFLPT
ncbi:hypothetical protein A3770_17p78820 [Chloropicon primus]|uniref:Protein BCCIP homolog n=1 Tax=Chloropicon primus TaxID=1764295 RepID=A0A5B8N0R4_9CHLO|nr:hypothetical protein A3770_17p78820 [Chloropicon primus]|eukprot:QDZ25364.1 hypothetical protein A3770_17p78820 [Chloropicon primus]